MDEIWAIVLAAGESRRMGSPKMILPFKGSTILGNVIRNITGSRVDNIIVVLGAEKQKIIQLLKKTSVYFCINDNYKEGMLSSVICGVRNLPPDLRAVLVFPGDQPLIAPETINLLIEVYRSSGKGILIPVCEKQRGHPVLLDKKYLNEISGLDHSEGLRSIFSKYPEDVIEVETSDSGILKDIDTYSEYQNEISNIVK